MARKKSNVGWGSPHRNRSGGASPTLLIDMSRMKPQGQSAIRCSYKHHPENKGFDAVLERVRFSLICRRCETAPCVAACPRKALEKVPAGSNGDSVLQRANMLCTGCGTCAIACPFGTVYDDLMPFASSVCDVCKDRLGPGEKPLCVRTCEDGSLDYAEAEPGGDLVEVVDGILVRVTEGSTWRPCVAGILPARGVGVSPTLEGETPSTQRGQDGRDTDKQEAGK